MATTDIDALSRIERIIRTYPEPLADLAAAWFDVRYGESRAGRALFERMLDLFEQTMTFLALVGTAEYVRCRAEVRSPTADAVLEQLRGGRPLSTGFWWQAFDAVLLPFENRANLLLVSELFDLRFGNRTGVARRTLLDGVPELRNAIRDDHPAVGGVPVALASVPRVRNRMRGHGITLPEHRYREVAEEFAGELDTPLDRAASLEGYPLLEICSFERASDVGVDGLVTVDALACRRRGSTPRPVRLRERFRLAPDDAALHPGAVVLLDRAEVGGRHPVRSASIRS